MHPSLTSAASNASDAAASTFVTAHVGPPILTLPPVADTVLSPNPVCEGRQPISSGVNFGGVTVEAALPSGTEGSPRPRFPSDGGSSGESATDGRVGELGFAGESRKLRSRSVDSGAVDSQPGGFAGRDRMTGSVASVDGLDNRGSTVEVLQRASSRVWQGVSRAYTGDDRVVEDVSRSGLGDPLAGDGEAAVTRGSALLAPSPVLGTLLLDFLFYYAKVFHPYELGVSVLLGYVFRRDAWFV